MGKSTPIGAATGALGDVFRNKPDMNASLQGSSFGEQYYKQNQQQQADALAALREQQANALKPQNINQYQPIANTGGVDRNAALLALRQGG